ncbi:hypothetical protein AOR11_24970, partial [Vibrio alginolyticus]
MQLVAVPARQANPPVRGIDHHHQRAVAVVQIAAVTWAIGKAEGDHAGLLFGAGVVKLQASLH